MHEYVAIPNKFYIFYSADAAGTPPCLPREPQAFYDIDYSTHLCCLPFYIDHLFWKLYSHFLLRNYSNPYSGNMVLGAWALDGM